MITGDCARCGALDDLNWRELCGECACSQCGDEHDGEPCPGDYDDECDACDGPSTWGVPLDEPDHDDHDPRGYPGRQDEPDPADQGAGEDR